MAIKPEGYKQTEIGIIPEDWEKKALTQISKNITMGQSPSSKYYNSDGKGLPLIQGNADINNRKTLIRMYTSHITKEAIKGDIILTVRAPVGNVAKATFNCCLGRGVCAISSNNDYLYHWFVYFEPRWNSLSSGSTFDSINGDELRKITLYIPSSETEQHAIAEVLSDMDSFIESLEKLVAKKRAIKQGAMQELLTGKRRLPGFAEEWEIVELGDLLEYEQPTEYIVYSPKYTSSGIPVLTAGKSFVLGYTIEQEGIYSKYPVIIFDDFLTISRYIDFPFKVKSSAVKLLKNKREYDNLTLIFEIMQTVKFTVVDHQRHWISQYSKIQVRIPPSKEQTAIAAVLSDMDAEIDALTAKLHKAKLIKQGMMQELLTGKIRLWNPKLSLKDFNDFEIAKARRRIVLNM
jgi:type I restriction enzyme S subunit